MRTCTPAHNSCIFKTSLARVVFFSRDGPASCCLRSCSSAVLGTYSHFSIIYLSSVLLRNIVNQISFLNIFNFTKWQSIFWCILWMLFSFIVSYKLHFTLIFRLSQFTLSFFVVICYTVSVTVDATKRKKENNKRKVSTLRRLPGEDYEQLSVD